MKRMCKSHPPEKPNLSCETSTGRFAGNSHRLKYNTGYPKKAMKVLEAESFSIFVAFLFGDSEQNRPVQASAKTV